MEFVSGSEISIPREVGSMFYFGCHLSGFPPYSLDIHTDVRYHYCTAKCRTSSDSDTTRLRHGFPENFKLLPRVGQKVSVPDSFAHGFVDPSPGLDNARPVKQMGVF